MVPRVGDAAGWEGWAEEELAAIRAAGRWREVRTLDGRGPVGTLEGRPVVNFASNDYLGLTAHPGGRSRDPRPRPVGCRLGSSRLIVGDRARCTPSSRTTSRTWKGTERAVLFPTGFAANLGVLAGLAGGPDVIVSATR